MKTVSLSGTPRASVGKKDAKAHRREHQVPCVMYGGKEQVHFTADEKTLAKLMHTPVAHIFDLTINGKQHTTIVQDVQYHPVTDRMLHVDFKEILPGKPRQHSHQHLVGQGPDLIERDRATGPEDVRFLPAACPRRDRGNRKEDLPVLRELVPDNDGRRVNAPRCR